MNLDVKKADFAKRPRALPEFHAATQCFDQDDVAQRLAAAELQMGHVRRVMNNEDSPKVRMGLHFVFGRALQEEIDQRRLESLDTPSCCGADYYRHVIEFMGFECVGNYPSSSRSSEVPETTYIHARPDGLLLVWDTYQGNVSHAELNFHWLGHQKNAHPGGGTSGGFYKMSDGQFAYCGSIHAVEGIRSNIERMLERGQFLSPHIPRDSDMAECRLVAEGDWSAARNILGENSSHFAMKEIVDAIEQDRFDKLPHWVQDMIGRPLIWNPRMPSCDIT